LKVHVHLWKEQQPSKSHATDEGSLGSSVFKSKWAKEILVCPEKRGVGHLEPVEEWPKALSFTTPHCKGREDFY
jgi:hypothetical protein